MKTASLTEIASAIVGAAARHSGVEIEAHTQNTEVVLLDFDGVISL